MRLFHKGISAALAYAIVTPMAPFDAVTRQIVRIGWMSSVFALLPAWESWPYPQLEIPDDSVPWTYEPGRILCGWLHPFTGGVPIRVPSDPGDEPPLFETVDEAAANARLAAIREQLGSIESATVVEAERARHMLALVSQDPLAGDRPTVFDTSDVLAAFDALPSPIDPEARRAQVTVAWRADSAFGAALAEMSEAVAQSLGAEAKVQQRGEFAILDLFFETLPSTVATSEWFEQLAHSLEELSVVESRLRERGLTAPRQTAEYWRKEHDVRLGVPWHRSNKTFLWGRAQTDSRP